MTVLDTVEVEPGRFVCTPHPVTLDGQTNVVCDLIPGETLYTFLSRQIDMGDQWEVTIGGVLVPVEHWMRVKPKHGQMIEVRGAVNKQVLMIVALVALTYFTFGLGAGVGGAWGAAGGLAGSIGGVGGTLIASAGYMAGSMLINKALGPKVGGGASQSQPDSVYALSGARNRARHYEPFPLLFGSVKITPDLASNPYSWYQGNDQFVGFVLNAGINVDRIDALSNGDTLLSSYDEVTTYTAGFPGMPEQDIPQHTNADTTSGGELAWEGDWVERTTSVDTVRIEIGLEYVLYDDDNKGRPYYNQETVVSEYRPVGTTTWLNLQTVNYRHDKPDTQRSSMVRDVPKGQYDVRVHRLGRAGKEKGAFSQFQWTTLVSVQVDETDYAGISRIGVTAKATGQLNGPMDEIAGVGHAKAMPVWDGLAWATATDRASGLSNPGAQILAYARGFHDENGKLIAGIGLADEQIDIEALKSFMLHCAAESYTYDNYVQSVRSHDDMLAAIALAGFGQVTWAGGRLSVVWAADGQPLSGVVNMATIKKGQFQVDYTLANAADGIEYTYFDRETWAPATLRVAAPGVTTMLNPATLTGEGVTTEAHAAQLARYHLAQHLYQYKDISYSTDLEHLSYRRLSVLALQHDLTKWGKGGRLVSVSAAGAVTLHLDEPVPAPTAGNAYIGLRVPGENVYRIFTVASFVGESDTITLTEPWPVDAAVPGDTPDNPAHDTIWIYDFQQTPGYRVRVVALEPESDLKGASVAVVPEPPEFWTYVKTGEYTPPVTKPMLPARPTASNLQITEARTVQGDTVFTELSATFDVSGPMDYASVHTAFYVEADAAYTELKEVAQTKTRTARWRISQAGQYAIVVRPYDANGIVGGVVSTVYATVAADIAPVALDYFTITELDGGVRSYAWGYTEDTIQPADYDGAEIRYITGNVADPDWAAMTPLGDDGIHPVAFESVNPPAGLWTFACRPRNTSGRLGPAFVLTVTLAENLAEIGQQTGAEIAAALAAALAADAKAAQEIIDRQTADAVLAVEQAVLRAQVGDILEADEWLLESEYPSGDLVQHGGGLYRALQDVPANTPITDEAYWEWVGNYASLGEAVGATAAQVVVNTADITKVDNDLTAVSETVSQHAARMPTGTGKLAADARVTSVESAAASATGAVGNRVGLIEARMPTGTDKLANEARVVTSEQAAANATGAVSGRLSTVESRMPSGTGGLATQASVTQVDQASVDRDNANAAAITAVGAGLSEVFTSSHAWKFATNHNGFTADRASLASFPLTSNNGATAITATAADPNFISPVISVPGNINSVVRALVRHRTAAVAWDGVLYWSNGNHGFNGSFVKFATVPAGNPLQWHVVEWDLSDNADWRGGTINRLRFDFAANSGSTVDVQWIAIGSKDPGNAAQATQVMRADVDSVTGKVNASYSLTLNANGYITGWQFQNDGSTGTVAILADKFSVVSPGAGQRTEYSGGNWRVYDAAGVLRVAMGVGI